MAGAQLWLVCVVAILVIVLMRSSRIPVALVALLAGVALGQATGISPRFPALDFGIHLSALTIPTWEQIVHGTQYAVLPQIPLTLTNAIIVTAAVTRQLFPRELHPVKERNLSLTTGPGNLIAEPPGGHPMGPGVGGTRRHSRFGARPAR